MNERVELDNIIEVSNTKHTKRNSESQHLSDDEDAPTAQPRNEEEKKYHENVI